MAYLLGDWSDLYQACLIFHCRLLARRRPSPGNQLATSRHGCQSSSGYGPLMCDKNGKRNERFTLCLKDLLRNMAERLTTKTNKEAKIPQRGITTLLMYSLVICKELLRAGRTFNYHNNLKVSDYKRGCPV